MTLKTIIPLNDLLESRNLTANISVIYETHNICKMRGSGCLGYSQWGKVRFLTIELMGCIHLTYLVQQHRLC